MGAAFGGAARPGAAGPGNAALLAAAGLAGMTNPIRPGQPDCAFFLKTGTCKFGETCKFNHPPLGTRKPAPAVATPTIGPVQYPVPHPAPTHPRTHAPTHSRLARHHHPSPPRSGP